MLICIVLYSSQDGRWKITDFGLTSSATSTREQTTHANRDKCSYRPLDSILGPKSDIWSMGCILYEIITGEKAFDNIWAVLQFVSSKKKKSVATLDWLDGGSKELLVLWIQEWLEVDP